MSDSESTHQKSEGKRDAKRLPDLYRLLQLAPLESDRTKIETALEKLADKATREVGKNEGFARRANIVCELGWLNLLDPDRKRAYDKRWRATFGAEDKHNALELARFEALLPSGDPSAPFDLAEYLKSESSDNETEVVADVEGEFETLLKMAKGSEQTNPGVDSPNPVDTQQEIERQSSPQQEPVIAKPVRRSPLVATPASQNGEANGFSLPSTGQASIAGRIRKKSKKSIFQSALGLLISLACVMGVLFAVIRSQLPSDNADSADPEADVNQTQLAKREADEPRGSGLPEVLGSGLPEVKGLDDASRTALASPGGTDSATPSADTRSVASAQAGVSRAEDGGDTFDTSTNQSQAPIQETSSVVSTMPDSSATETKNRPREDELTEDDKAAWSEAMKTWRALLADGSFAAAQKQRQAVEAMLSVPIQKQQYDRLKTVADLAEQFQSALGRAVAGLSTGEAFEVSGPTWVSFVEGNAQQIVLKISGRNKTFRLNELPLGIAVGLADLELDLAHPSSLAQKAAYGLLHTPNNNRVALAEVLNWMASAEAERAVPAGTTEVFQDDYDL